MSIEKEVIKRLESIYNLDVFKKNEPKEYEKEYKKMKYMLSLGLKERLKELSKSIPYSTEHGFNSKEFLTLCSMFDIKLSYNAENRLLNNVDYILNGSISYRGYWEEKEYRELLNAMEAMDIIVNYPEDIEDYKEENVFLKNVS